MKRRVLTAAAIVLGVLLGFGAVALIFWTVPEPAEPAEETPAEEPIEEVALGPDRATRMISEPNLRQFAPLPHEVVVKIETEKYTMQQERHLLEGEKQRVRWERQVAEAEEARRAAQEAVEAERRAASQARSDTPPAASRASSGASPAAASSGGPNFAALAQCESGGNPRAVSPSGKYRGAFQFDLATWASVGMSGDPIDHSYAVQEEAARRLYASRGAQPWPHCGRYL